MPNLGLNEALLVVKRGNITEQFELFHQVEECFGCPLTLLRPIDDEPDKYIVDARHSVQLELRQVKAGAAGSCKFNNLALNSQGRYRIDVESTATATGAAADDADDGGQQFECKLKTLDYGECLLCPFAILICFLFAIMALEQAYTKFWLKKARSGRASAGQKLSSSGLNEEEEDASSGDEPTTTPPPESGNPELQERAMDSGRQLESSVPSTSKIAVATFNPPAPIVTTTTTAAAAGPRIQALEAKRRIECLDVFRGLTLAGMIFVNYGGAGYAIWDHKPWDGITLADFVFPFFIFSMGASIAISTKALIKRHRKSFKTIATKIFWRASILMLLGICLNSKAINYEQADGLTKLRLTGVLQRFSVSYLVIAFMYTIELTLSKWTQAQSLSNVPYVSRCIGIIFEVLTAVNYTTIYIYVTFYLDYDSTGNCPIGYTGPGGLTSAGQYVNCTGGSAAWLDRLILGENHLYNDHEMKQIFKTQVSHDPEGILGYTTSIVLTLIGLQCGKILNGNPSGHKQKLLSLAKWILALATSCSLVVVIPINKRLWSLTFVLVTALAAFAMILAFYILIDIYSCKKAFLVRLLASAGKNSIFLYVGHSLIYGMLPWWFPVSDQASHMQQLFRLTWSTFVWLLIAHYMAHKKLFVKI